MKTKITKTQNTDSPWYLFEKWLIADYDQQIPQSVIDSKKISQNVVLYKFQYSPYIVYLNELFNNFNLYYMPLEDVFKMTKRCVKMSGFKAPYIEKTNNQIEKTKLLTCLKKKFYFLKSNEICLLISYIDKSPDKDAIYESFGLYISKKQKTNAEDLKKLKNITVNQNKPYSLKQLLENFSND